MSRSRSTTPTFTTSWLSGDMTGKNGHDALAKQIAYAGKEWTKKHWRWEDMETYAFRLYLEWARVASKDQTDVDYIGAFSKLLYCPIYLL